MAPETRQSRSSSRSSNWKKLALALCPLIIGSITLWWALAQQNGARHPISAANLSRLSSGSIAQMDSPVFSYSPSASPPDNSQPHNSQRGWIVDANGADPREPLDPWRTPSGVITFEYVGSELALNLAVGNYWGYIFVTVDGEPANLLPDIRGNPNSEGDPAGYKTFYEPEKAENGAPVTRWVRVHRDPTNTQADATDDKMHTARIELWRSWGQVPIRGVAVDALPADPWPAWPSALILVSGVWLLVGAVSIPHNLGLSTHSAKLEQDGRERKLSHNGGANGRAAVVRYGNRTYTKPSRGESSLPQTNDIEPPASVSSPKLASVRERRGGGLGWGQNIAQQITSPLTHFLWPIAILGLAITIAGITIPYWIITLIGLALLGLAALIRPAIWISALLFALPFYFSVTVPILPNRAIGLIDIGVLGGVMIMVAHHLLGLGQNGHVPHGRSTKVGLGAILALFISWAFVATFAAEHTDVAIREWRTIFLYAGLFAWMLAFTQLNHRNDDRWLLICAWLAGGTVVALVALGQWATGTMLIEAEGVFRVRGLYGSPNNLALYLDRTLAVTLALAVFGQFRLWVLFGKVRVNVRLVAARCALVQLVALLLTYSRGSTMLALPVTLLVLMVVGWLAFRRDPQRRRQAWWLVAVALIAVLVMAPSLNTDRLRGLVDLQSGTGFLRAQIWRSGWQMAVDHPIFGVGPDNFLYAFRSGYLLPAAWQEPNLNHPHNVVLDLWTRLGILGLVLAIVGVGTGLWQIGQNLLRGWSPALNLGLLAAICAALAHGLIDVGYALPDLMLVWVVLFWFAMQTNQVAPISSPLGDGRP